MADAVAEQRCLSALAALSRVRFNRLPDVLLHGYTHLAPPNERGSQLELRCSWRCARKVKILMRRVHSS